MAIKQPERIPKATDGPGVFAVQIPPYPRRLLEAVSEAAAEKEYKLMLGIRREDLKALVVRE